MTPEQVARFWSKVDKSGECWIWTRGKSSKGYGEFAIGHRNVQTHRMAWELTHGPIPLGLHVLHECDNPPCCNPAHLFLGTNADNMADRDAKGHTARGEHLPHTKLSAAQVRDIKTRLAAGEIGEVLAREYGVTPVTITHIRRNHTWKHI